MSAFDSAQNFSLPTSTQQRPVVVPVPVEVPVAVPVPVGATGHAGVHHSPAPTVNAPSLDSFSPQLDVNEITNSGTPSSSSHRAQTHDSTSETRPIKEQVSTLASSAQNNAASLANQAGNIANQASGIAAAKIDEFTAGKPTSDPSVTPVGPPSHDQNPAEEHVDGLTRGIAGVVLTAPLVAVEKLSQTHFAQQVASHLPGHATGGPSLVEQATPYAQQAKEQAIPLAQQAAATAQSLAGQAAGYASSALNSIYGAAQSKAQDLQPNPTDTLDELTNRLDKGHTGEHHSTAVTAVEPSPVLPIDGAALLPNQGKTDKALDGVDAKYAGGSSTPQQNQNQGTVGGHNTHDAEQGQVSTGQHEASSVAPIPDESSSVLKNDKHDKNSTQSREAHGAIYEKNIHSDRAPAAPIAPVEHYTPIYAEAGSAQASRDSSAPQTGTSSGPPLGLGHPIESAIPLEPIASGNQSTGHHVPTSSNIAKEPKPAEPTPAQFTDRTSTNINTNNTSGSSVTDKAKNVDYDDARQKADVATDKGASAASSALDSAAGKAGINKDHVPSAEQIKKTADNKVTEKITGDKRGHREPIDTSPPTDHDNATPQFLEGEPKAGLGTKIKHLFHKDDKNNSDF